MNASPFPIAKFRLGHIVATPNALEYLSQADILSGTRLLQDPTAKGIHRVNYTTRDGQTKRCISKPEDEWIVHNIEAVVTPEVWEQCNRLIEESLSKQKRPAKKPVNVFVGIAYCECGERIFVPANSPKYICRSCRNKIPIADLEAIFCEEIKAYSLSPAEIAAYLRKADGEIADKQQLLTTQQAELQKVQRETTRVYQLYQDGQLDSNGFGKFYRPLEERAKQLGEDIPKLQAEIDVRKVNNLSAEEVATEAANLHRSWPELQSDQKRQIVEAIVDKMIIGKGEVTLDLCYLPPGKDMVLGWRKGWDSNPR